MVGQNTIEFPKLPESVEKPALQKAEIEWKAAKASSAFQSHSKCSVDAEPDRNHADTFNHQRKSQDINNVDNKEPSELELTISRTTN